MFHSTSNLGFSLSMNIIISMLAFVVAYYSYRAYKLTKDYNFGFYSLGYLFFSASFAINGLGIFLNSLCVFSPHIFAFYGRDASFLLFRFFMVLGIVLLFFSTKYLKNHFIRKLATFVSMILIVLSMFSEVVFYLVSVILLIKIALYYFNLFIQRKGVMATFVLISVILLLVGILLFLFTIPNICIIQPIIFFSSFLFMQFVVIKSFI